MNQKHLIQSFLLALYCGLLANCASSPPIVETIQFTRVQTEFKECTAQDNQLRIGAKDEKTITDQVKPRYQKVIAGLKDLENSQLNPSTLRANAYLLRGVSQWRVGDMEAAASSASKGRSERDLITGSRDHLFLILLPGQIANTRMMRAWHAADKKMGASNFPSMESHFEDAGRAIRAAEREIQASTSDGAKRYVHSEKARILRNWETMINLSLLTEDEQQAALSKAGNAFEEGKVLEDIIAEAQATAGAAAAVSFTP
jgi:hypothetical protein